MSLGFMIFMGLCLFANSKKLNRNQFIILIGWLLIAIFGLVAFTEFLISKGWELGIPGADMRFYYQAAKKLQLGASWDDLANVSTLYFSELKFGTLTYFLFAQFVSFMLQFPLFGEQVALYFIYVSFVLLAGICAIDAADFLKEFNQGKISTASFVLALFCVAVPFAAYRLMRDILIYFLVIETFCYIQKRKKLIVEILLILLCVVFRSYTVVLIFPYFAYKHLGRKTATITCVASTAFLVVSIELLNFLKQIFVVPWEFDSVNVGEVVQFLMFPNVFNQSSIMMHWNENFGRSMYTGGANLPGMYYLMSVWNIVVLGLFFFGIIYKFRDKINEKIIWCCALLNIGIIYSLLYNSETTETRQKLMIVIPLVYFASEGWKFLRSINISTMRYGLNGATIYSSAMFCLIILLLNIGAL